MKQLLRLRCSAALLALGVAAGLSAQEIAVKPDVMVTGATVTLGDVATLTGFSPPVAAQLASVPMGASPRVGYPERVPRSTLEQRVRAHTPALAVRWSGADTINLQRASSTVSAEQIMDQAAIYLHQLLTGEQQRVALQPLEELADIPVNQGRVNLRVRPMPYTEGMRKRAKVWVDVFVDGIFNRSVPVLFAVEVWRDAWVMRESAAAGDGFDCGRLERRAVNLAALPPGSVEALGLPSACDQMDVKARRTIAQGEPVLSTAWATKDSLRTGETLALRVTGRGVVLEAPVVLMSDNAAHKRVRVRYANRVLDADVREPGIVELAAKGA